MGSNEVELACATPPTARIHTVSMPANNGETINLRINLCSYVSSGYVRPS